VGPNAPVPQSTPRRAHLGPLSVLEAVSGLSFFPGALGEEEKGGVDTGSACAGVALGNVGPLLLAGHGEVLPAQVLKALALEGVVPVVGGGSGRGKGASSSGVSRGVALSVPQKQQQQQQQQQRQQRDAVGGGRVRHLCDVVDCTV
jgi:hypothetical protein